MKKQGKIDKAAYRRYVKMFEAEKKDHNIYWGTRRYTYGQYVKRRQLGKSNRDLVNTQARFTPEQKKIIWQSYKEKKPAKRGQKKQMEKTYWGETSPLDLENVAGYHRTLRGLLGDENQVHLLIANRIKAGEKKEDVLAEYGIIDY